MEILELSHNNMVANQLLTHHINSPKLVESLYAVPRHLFVPDTAKHAAYADRSITLNSTRTLIEAGILARMIQAANITSEETVLDIACGSGYSTALIAHLSHNVVGIEPDNTLASKANSILNALKIPNAIIIGNELSIGHPASGPYNVIFINGAVEEISDTLYNQLADGGRIITGFIRTPHLTEVVSLQKNGTDIARTTLFETLLPELSEMYANNG